MTGVFDLLAFLGIVAVPVLLVACLVLFLLKKKYTKKLFKITGITFGVTFTLFILAVSFDEDNETKTASSDISRSELPKVEKDDVKEKAPQQNTKKEANKTKDNTPTPIQEDEIVSSNDSSEATDSSLYSADDVLTAFQNSNLAIPKPRENTSKQCPELGCTKLITTEVVSIYEWPSQEKAESIQKEYNFGDYQNGPFIIRFNVSHNSDGSIQYEPKPSKEAYIIALDNLLK